MKDRREESMLSNYLSGLWEILGRDKVTSFLSDHESGQNSRTAVRRLRLRVVGEPLGTMALVRLRWRLISRVRVLVWVMLPPSIQKW
jgi:hypothetical protein